MDQGMKRTTVYIKKCHNYDPTAFCHNEKTSLIWQMVQTLEMTLYSVCIAELHFLSMA